MVLHVVQITTIFVSIFSKLFMLISFLYLVNAEQLNHFNSNSAKQKINSSVINFTAVRKFRIFLPSQEYFRKVYNSKVFERIKIHFEKKSFTFPRMNTNKNCYLVNFIHEFSSLICGLFNLATWSFFVRILVHTLSKASFVIVSTVCVIRFLR